MKMSKVVVVSLVALALAAGPLRAADQVKPQTVCPVLGGNIDKKVYIDYQGKRIYFCCQGCEGKFKEDPEKYLKKFEEQGITLEKCPEGK
jgi:YHS domain-containing protein